jgi:hypothetical protein
LLDAGLPGINAGLRQIAARHLDKPRERLAMTIIFALLLDF